MDDAVSQSSSSKRGNPGKSSSSSSTVAHFLLKAAVFTVILVLIPLFPSLSPQFLNSSLHARSWELLQLIFVGLAVSYGLFSKKNDESEKEYCNNSNQSCNSTQSYFSRLLQLSSVFDEAENGDDDIGGENKVVQKWSFMYQKDQDPVVVAEEKPLLLPVRPLKQVDIPRRRNGEEPEETAVLPSPIPWRSRSRIEASHNHNQLVSDASKKELKKTLSVASSPKLPKAPPPQPPPPRETAFVKSNSDVTTTRRRTVLENGKSAAATRTLRSSKSSITTEKVKKYEDATVEASEGEKTDGENDAVHDHGENRASSGGGKGGDDDPGPDVDKKADEFIAKFREQIRLQRIESIRRSTAQRSSKVVSL